MSGNVQSLLDLVAGSVLLHRGGEADIYRVSVKDHSYILKWYKAKDAFDCGAVEKIAPLNVDGLYKIREFGERDGHSYVVYDYISGVAASDVQVPVVVALCILRSLVKTLETLNSKGLHHGDLNPGNIVLTLNKGLLQPVLIDCGILGPGALAYAAPERFQGRPADEKSDVYSLGMLLFRLVYGLELVSAEGFDEYATKSLDIDRCDPSQELYASGRFTVPEISALAPLWKATLRADADNRAEDLDELDELLEIALGKLALGDAAVQKVVEDFVEDELQEKMRQKVPEPSEEALPYKIAGRQGKFCWWKVSFFLGLVLILIVWAVSVLKSGKSDVDDAGDLLLKKSRSLDVLDMLSDSVSPEQAESVVDSSLLRDLPTPELRE
jgi:serine/threonine protein kinase